MVSSVLWSVCLAGLFSSMVLREQGFTVDQTNR